MTDYPDDLTTLSSLELMQLLVGIENDLGRRLDLHRWAEHLKTADDLERLVAVRVHPRKVVATDLDGTVWSGVLVEATPDNHSVINESLTKQLASLRSAGLLVAIVSKNDEERVPLALELQPAAHRINWNDKAANLVEIAEELNLGIDSFAFIDDSPQERDRVRTALPGVVVLDPACDLLLLDAMLPDETTPEDSARAQMYAEEREREASRVEIPDEEEWLRSLEMVVVTRSATLADLPRVHQLLQRTNQFNNDPASRPLEEDVARVFARSEPWVAEARDRFGAYGIVGAFLYDDDYRDHFAVSCRVIGRGVAECLASRDDIFPKLRVHRTEKNQPFVRWFDAGKFDVPDWLTHEARECPAANTATPRRPAATDARTVALRRLRSRRGAEGAAAWGRW